MRGTTMNTDHIPHLEAIASQGDELPDVTLAYRVGYADAQAERIAREAFRLEEVASHAASRLVARGCTRR